MNKVILMGRLTRDPDVRYSQGENPTAVARYSLAVDRRFSKNEENSTDFINIVAFGKAGEFAEKYLKVYTTDVVAEDQEFCESKNAASANGSFGNGGDSSDGSTAGDGDFMKFDSSTDSTLPF